MNKLSRELITIAKSLDSLNRLSFAKKRIAGGGAGIAFTATDVEGQLLYEGEIKNGKFILDKQPKTIKKLQICKFDALGYDDGQRNVKGKYVFSDFYLNDQTKKDIEDMICEAIQKKMDEETEDQYIEIGVYFSKTDSSEMIFRGWIRGVLQKGDIIDFPVLTEITSSILANDQNICYAEIYDETDGLKISGEISNEGESWYEDTFINNYQDQDED